MEKNINSNNFQDLTLSDKMFANKESFIISHKSFLEIILDQIKEYQYIIISEDNNKKTMKQNLIIFKNSLLSTLKEKTEKQKHLENILNIKKAKLQQELFDKTINKNSRIIQYNNYNTNDDYKINNHIINYLNEIQLLQKFSFKTENEINKFEFEIQKIISSIINLRTMRFFQEENLEISANQQKLKSKATHIMNKQLKIIQQNLLICINDKIKNDLKVKKIKEEIEYYKKIIKKKEEYENISSEFSFFENSKDYIKSILIKDNLKNNKKSKIKEKYNCKNNISHNRRIKGNRHSLDDAKNHNKKYNINIDDNNSKNIDLKEFERTINQKMFRSISNRIHRFSAKNLKGNCKLNLNFNFNINNLNIINGAIHKDIDNNNLNLSYNNKSLNEDENKKILN